MNIRIDTSQLANSKDQKELIDRLTDLLNLLERNLQAQPNFLLLKDEGQEVPKNLPVNTIVFQFNDTSPYTSVGYYNGDDILIL